MNYKDIIEIKETNNKAFVKVETAYNAVKVAIEKLESYYIYEYSNGAIREATQDVYNALEIVEKANKYYKKFVNRFIELTEDYK